jgi:hypothetical protein
MSLLSRWPWATRWTGAGEDPLLQSKTEHRISLLYLDLISLICGLISISNLKDICDLQVQYRNRSLGNLLSFYHRFFDKYNMGVAKELVVLL